MLIYILNFVAILVACVASSIVDDATIMLIPIAFTLNCIYLELVILNGKRQHG